VVTPKAVEGSVALGDHTMDNKFLKVTIDENFNMVSIYDKDADREVIDTAKGPGNQLEVYEDFPRDWEAWEISDYYRSKRYTIDEVISAEPVRDGARSGFKVCRRFMDSTVEQYIWMYEDLKKIDFDTTIDWKQEHLLAKVAFPVKINSNRATFEVQFGTLERPTHTNTSWDAAKFEVCAHKYCDFAEYGYGVAMLNDCKYGHDIHDGVMRLTLLKSATYPNVDADRCMHYLTYSIVPHEGDYREAGVVQMAYDLNKPMTAVTVGAQDGTLADSYSLVSVSAPNVILETVKKAEDSDALVLRMYEAYNKKANATITLGFEPKRVTLVGLMEDEISEVAVCGNSFTLPVKPFEIVTVKVER
jgi:alpha-mannosidase